MEKFDGFELTERIKRHSYLARRPSADFFHNMRSANAMSAFEAEADITGAQRQSQLLGPKLTWRDFRLSSVVGATADLIPTLWLGYGRELHRWVKREALHRRARPLSADAKY